MAQALEGFNHHLAAANPPVIVFEAHDHSLRKLGSSREMVLAALNDHGYEMWTFDVGSAHLEPAGKVASDLIAIHATAIGFVRDRLRVS